MAELTKRSQKEILDRIEAVKQSDWMGTQRSDLLDYLTYQNALPFLKEGVKEEEFSKVTGDKTPAQRIKDYMEFAWDKANNFRGLSAGRSMEHMLTWLWLDSQDEFLAENDITNYEYYGKPQLVAICELYGIDSSKYDDGVRKNSEE